MRSLLLLLLIFVTACSTAPVKTENYRLRTIDTPKGVALASNDFYSVYYVYMNVIRALELDAVLSREEIEKVISRIIDTLKQGDAAQIMVPGFKGGLDLRATVRTDFKISEDNTPNLLIVSNYDPRLKRTVAGDDQKDAYATYFFMVGDKLIKHQYVTQAKSQSELNAMTLNRLADYYLLDGDVANDQLGKVMLKKAIAKNGDEAKKFLMYLTLSEYYLLDGNIDKARAQLAHAEAIINAQRDARIRQRMSRLYSYSGDIIFYYNQYHH